MKLINLIVALSIVLILSNLVYPSEINYTSYIRILLGERGPSQKDLEKVKKVSARTFVRGSKYEGQIELWKDGERYYLINVVELEDYVKGVVASELGVNWPKEALKAQSVLARTYALAHIIRNRNKSFYDVTSSVFHQVYKGDETTEDVEKAVNETKGQILTYNGEPIIAYYHACSVGQTEDPKEVFGKEYPYIKPVQVPSTPSPYTLWEKKISFESLTKALSMNKITDVKILHYTSTGRVKELEFSNEKSKKVIKATDLRRLLQWSTLPSTMIHSIKIEEDGIVFEGSGFGHGVGMCQWCSFQMAQEGKNYREILQYFYPNTEISQINGNN